MKLLFSLLLIPCVAITVNAQEVFEKGDAQRLVETFFEGFHKGDTLLMKSVMADHVLLQSVSTNREGEHKITDTDFTKFLTAIATRPDDQVWNEQIQSYAVQVDGNLAHVWTPYKFYFNGNFSHCGANAFTFARTDKGWKLIHLIDSRRRAGCKE